ncbi:MAG: sugar kinase [Sedimentisphaerales bacterium]|nr:sugar kinase [Sedimentisphaerales bacterium]
MSDQKINKDIDVLCVGIIVYDVMGKPIDEIPDWGRLVTFKQVEHHIGGCAVNTGVDLVRLSRGELNITIGGCVGTDGAGHFVKKRMFEEKLNVTAVLEIEHVATSYTFVMIGSDGQRRYFHHFGANAFLRDTDIPDMLLDRSRILHIGGSFVMPKMDGEPTANLLRRAKERSVMTFLDTVYNPDADCRALIEPCAPYLDVFIPSIEEAEMITGKTVPEEILDVLSDLGIGVVGVKLGKEGCIVRGDGRTHRIPIYPVKAVDSSGAGDAFMAGFIYATMQEWPMEKRARFANAVAAHCVGSVGCNTGIPAAEDVLKFMEGK